MREIKFRMWTGQRYIYDQNIVFDCMRQQYSGLYDHVKLHESDFEQFTGLHDKNGKEIYEGDIILNPLYEEPYVVEYAENLAGYVGWGDDRICGCYLITDENIKIIGNIHENPELIK